MNPNPHYATLAPLFDYPSADYPSCVHAARAVMAQRNDAATDALDAFAQLLPGDGECLSAEALDLVQELFVRSFDVQAITTLSVGYVMFGDDYKRGELMVNLHREHDDAGVSCGSELPDHLPVVLRLMAEWQDRELAAEFAAEILYPAIGRMIAEFGTDRTEQRQALYQKHYRTLIGGAERARMFRYPLVALHETLAQDFGLTVRPLPQQANDFLRSLGRELAIEDDEARAPEDVLS